MGFEVSPFKLSQEMIDVMGGDPSCEQFTYFMEQVSAEKKAPNCTISSIFNGPVQGVRAFLALRAEMSSVLTLVDLMLATKLVRAHLSLVLAPNYFTNTRCSPASSRAA